MSATIREVAERAGVALSSVSRVLNDHPDVSQSMRQRVLRAAEALEYEPDLLAASLRKGFTRMVGFVVRDISNPLFADIVKGAEDTLWQAGYAVILTNSDRDPNMDAEYIRLLGQRRVDGLILSLQSETHPPTLEALASLRGPVVLLDRDVALAGPQRPAAVLCDHGIGVREAIADILSRGHRRVALIAGPQGVRASAERLRGYRLAHEDAGVAVDTELVRLGAYTKDYGYAELNRLLDLPEPPTAVLAGGVQLTYGALSALSGRGVRLGRDVAFVSCDEVELMQLHDPPISVVTRDAVRMGQLAAELILEMLVGGGPPRSAYLPTMYIPRGSTANAPAR